MDNQTPQPEADLQQKELLYAQTEANAVRDLLTVAPFAQVNYVSCNTQAEANRIIALWVAGLKGDSPEFCFPEIVTSISNQAEKIRSANPEDMKIDWIVFRVTALDQETKDIIGHILRAHLNWAYLKYADNIFDRIWAGYRALIGKPPVKWMQQMQRRISLKSIVESADKDIREIYPNLLFKIDIPKQK